MRRRRPFLNTILGVVIAAGCSQAPSTAPTEFQSRVLPPLSAFSVVQHLDASYSDWDHDDADDTWGNPAACSPLKSDQEYEEIGSKGGSLDVGPHTLVVPPGALLKRTWIKAEVVSDGVNSVKFSPEGLQFLKPVYLFLSYANCTKSVFDQAEVLYTSDDLSAVLEHLPSFDDISGNTVVALITHFSRYAVAY